MTGKKFGKNIAVTGVVLALILSLAAFFLLRSSSVSGRVTWEGRPVAAGQIVFESSTETFSSQISDGKYEIKNPRLAGDYTVRIEIHFVDSSDAAHFYKNLTNELNPEKRFDPQKDLEPGSEVVPVADPTEEEAPSSINRVTIKEQLGNGWNTRNYDLPLSD